MQLQSFYRLVIKHRKTVILFFIIAAFICAAQSPMVGVQYDMMAYLPEQSPSTIAIRTLEDEYQLSIPNCRVMVQNVSVPEALQLKSQLAAVDGVSQVTWLDDSLSLIEPLAMQKKESVDAWYVDKTAVFSLTLEKDKQKEAILRQRAKMLRAQQ